MGLQVNMILDIAYYISNRNYFLLIYYIKTVMIEHYPKI